MALMEGLNAIIVLKAKLSHYLISFTDEKTLHYKAHNITIIMTSILAQSVLMTYVCVNKVDR